MILRVFRKIIFVSNQVGQLAMAVDIVHKTPKKNWAQSELNGHLAVRLKFIKGFEKLYKGNSGHFLLWP